jgi:hypothetical protein
VVNTGKGARVKIAYVDPEFIAWFGDKIEKPTGKTTLRYQIFTRPAAFAQAVQENRDIGFVTKTTPGELFSMLAKQPDGPKSPAGPLATNDYANLFEMDDISGIPRLVNVFWRFRGNGWNVYAREKSLSIQWCNGHQLFSRVSCRRSDARPPRPRR